MFEIKDLTYNAQFNFCLPSSRPVPGRFDRSESFGRRRVLVGHGTAFEIQEPDFQRSLPCDFRAPKDSMSSPAVNEPPALRESDHGRDEIEFNLKSQKF